MLKRQYFFKALVIFNLFIVSHVMASTNHFLYLGAGAAENSIQTNPSFSSALTSTESSNSLGASSQNGRANLQNAINPYFQLGFLQALNPAWDLGMRLNYTYLNAQNNTVGNFYQLQYNHLLELLFQVGKNITQKSTVLLGVGPNLMNNSIAVDRYLTNSGLNVPVINQSAWNFGFTGSLDYLYHFTSTLFLDLAYAYSYNYVNQNATALTLGGVNTGVGLPAYVKVSVDNPHAAIQAFSSSLNYAFSV